MKLLALSLKGLFYRGMIKIRFILRWNPSKTLFKKWYNLLSDIVELIFKGFSCMNYGYHKEGMDLELSPVHAGERYPLQLYHYIATGDGLVNVEGKDVLEVGSGRGGGASYVAGNLFPRSLTGLELSQAAVEFCNREYTNPHLNFVQGDSEEMPFENDKFDIVYNIESSHCYPDFSRFLAEVKRVLIPGGYFILTDFRFIEKVEEFKTAIHESGMRTLKETDITDNVTVALEKDSERRTKIIEESGISKFLFGLLKDFAGVKGSGTYWDFANKKRLYLTYVLQK